MVNEMKKPNCINLEKESETMLKSSFKYVCKDTQKPLYQNQIG